MAPVFVGVLQEGGQGGGPLSGGVLSTGGEGWGWGWELGEGQGHSELTCGQDDCGL